MYDLSHYRHILTYHLSPLPTPAIEALCSCPLSLASRQQLARKTVLGGGHGSGSQGNSLLGYLKSEVHVATLCVGVGVLVKWCEVIGEGEEVPSALIDHIKVTCIYHVWKEGLEGGG